MTTERVYATAKPDEREQKLSEKFAKLEERGYDFALAIATEEEVRNGAACGQLAMIADLL